jgi:TonB-linked SusC/RagA family outer membrane protein
MKKQLLGFFTIHGHKRGRLLSMILVAVVSTPAVYANIEGNKSISVNSSRPVTEKWSTVQIITGAVKDGKGLPVPGANILIKGSSIGTSTSADGSFSINVPDANAVLVVSSIGYVTKEFTVGNQANIDVLLEEDVNVLGEVVVTALGIERKAESLTYSTQAIKGAELTRSKDPNPMNNLIGKISGMQINRSSSGIGGSVNITLRGLKSNRSNQPLYVVDGLPITNTAGSGSEGAFGGGTDRGDILSTLNADDITSINVLKGASASALYGSQGANGAIMITTKKGTSGRTRIDFSSSATFDKAFYMPKLQYSYGQTPSSDGSKSYSEESWGAKGNFKDNTNGFLNTGSTLINSVGLSGGTDKVQNYFSYANTTNKGILPTNKFNQNTLSFRNSSKFFGDALSFDGNLMYSTQKIHNRPSSGLYFGVLPGVYMFPRGLDFDKYKQYEYLSPTRNLYLQDWYNINYDDGQGGTHHQQNPYWVLNRNATDQTRNNIIGAANLKYAFTDWLSLSVRGTLNQQWNKFERKVHAGTQGIISGETIAGVLNDNGRYQREEGSGTTKYGDILLIGNKNLNKDLELNFTLGGSINDIKSSNWALDARKLKTANAFLLNNIYREAPINSLKESFVRRQIQSVFASANLGIMKYLYVDLTARNDWASTLANTPSAKSGYFYYSAGITTILTEMFKLPEWNNYSKLRFSYAEVGNDVSEFVTQIPSAKFGSGLLEINNSGVFEGVPLKPEISGSFELGYEARFFNNRLNLDVALYKTNTKNQYFSFDGPLGLLNTRVLLNAGDVENKGIEISLGYDIIETDKLTWRTGLNYTANRNKVLKLHPKLAQTYPIGGNFNVLRLNGSFGDFWGKTFLRDEAGKMMVSTKDSIPLSGPDGYIGNSNPKALVGWNNTITYGNLSLNFTIDGRFGGQVISITEGYLNSFGVSQESADARNNGGVTIDAVNEDGQAINKISAKKYYAAVGNRDGIIEGEVYSATNIRMRELSLYYNLPIKSKFISSASLGLVGRNLFFFKNNAPYDPELNTTTGVGGQGLDIFGLPTTRSMGVNLKLSF